MKRFVPAISALFLALASMTMVACSDGGRGGDGGEGGSGSSGDTTGTTGTTSGGTTSGGTTSGGSTGTGMTAMDWTGTWTVDSHYDVSCDTTGFGNFKEATWDQTDIMQISGNGSGGLDVAFPQNVNYALSGTGNDKGMTLAGPFPAKDEGGKGASTVQAENTVSVKVDAVMDAKNASGALSGNFKGGFGEDCTITAGTVLFSR